MTLKIKPIKTAPLPIRISAPPGPNPIVEGTFIGHAIIRTKPENKALLDRIDASDMGDDEVMRLLYTGFDDLENDNGKCSGEEAFREVLEGEMSAYLAPAAIQAYYTQYGEARVGNSRGRRGRS